MRIALLSYRSRPHSGGQGVYIRHLSRQLAALGHDVEVISGPPLPELDPGVALTVLPSLDLYREPDPFRTPRLREFRSWIDVLEWLLMCTGTFPEPLTFSLRARRHLRLRRGAFDVLHDNQGLGYGLLLLGRGTPLVATVHHPITVDRDLELAAARGWRRVTLRRWYSFIRMQARVARRIGPLTTVSQSSADAIAAAFRVPRGRLRVIPVGVDASVFVPPAQPRVPGRIVTVTSADVALKGLVDLVEALAKVRTERAAELVVVGTARADGPARRAVERHALGDAVRFVSGLDDTALAALLGSAEVAVVPSRYEGFSLPAVEAMATATALVATDAGALPEVTGPHGHAALHVPPGDPAALAAAVGRILDDAALRARLGAAGRARVLEHFTWRRTAERTAAWYREVARC
ncbi:MAG TPA: glycosyltransferase family 4 protein [Pseudonocardia sp.]|nr:glycosyltransferase family 4 protein [Pseudonocardia sp.]